MRITMLGTSHGVPEADRRCSCNMIQVAGNTYFVDMGTDVVHDLQSRHIPIESVKAVFTTHKHGDHTNGLFSFSDLLNWYFKKSDPEIFMTIQPCIDIINEWTHVLDQNPRELKFKLVHEGLLYDDGIIKVTSFKTMHCDYSYSFLIEAEGKKVFFTGDLKGPDIDLISPPDEKIDLFIGENAHFPIMRYVDVLKKWNISRLIINHYSFKRIVEFPEFKKAMEPLIPEIASDGMEIEL